MQKNFTVILLAFIYTIPSFGQRTYKPQEKNKIVSHKPVQSFNKKKNELDISGQWRGYFDDNGNIGSYAGDNTEYVLELDVLGTTVRGYSYSYFQDRKYYVICSLSGSFNKNTNTLSVTETARIKGLTPPNWSDCLQTHLLIYEKSGTTERLVGKWRRAPGQTGSCGSGSTTLTRKTLIRNITAYNNIKKAGSPFSAPISNKNTNKPKTYPPVAKNEGKLYPPEKSTTPQNIITNPPAEPKNIEGFVQPLKSPDIPNEKATGTEIDINKRNNTILKTIEIENKTFRVDLYDNGEIDGDSVSLFYNGKLLLSHKRLSDKPITLTLDATDSKSINELTMYAENLGSIPPNTALMIVTDGESRYEVRISSDLQKSGTIRFAFKPKKE